MRTSVLRVTSLYDPPHGGVRDSGSIDDHPRKFEIRGSVKVGDSKQALERHSCHASTLITFQVTRRQYCNYVHKHPYW